MDFAKNQKTITGILIFMIPSIAKQFGFETDDLALQMLINDIFMWVGGIVASYGGLMKIWRATKHVFSK